jgi:Ni/Fe-hydrogenase 1 B-type cytochrome subunit
MLESPKFALFTNLLQLASKVNKVFHREYIYDGVQRILHWWIALAVVFLITTGYLASILEGGADKAYLWNWHILIGKILIVGLVARFAWGIFGPHHARFGALIHLKEWKTSLKTKKAQPADSAFGHNPQASLTYLGLYTMVALMTVSGVALASILHGDGPLAEKLLDDFRYVSVLQFMHEYIWWGIAGFILLHVGAFIYHEWHEGIPVAQSMISGYQYRTKKSVKNDQKKR